MEIELNTFIEIYNIRKLSDLKKRRDDIKYRMQHYSVTTDEQYEFELLNEIIKQKQK